MSGESVDPALSTVDEARLAALRSSLDSLRETVRYVDYRQAERDCEALACRLLAAFARQDLRRFSFRAIPRGGLIVLGMLSYWLGLDGEQLEGEVGEELVLVDDCALTGARIHQALASSSARQVVVAHLYSHPSLRAELCAEEERVVACLAARDLDDAADRLFSTPQARAAWQASWRGRLGEDRYWHGLTELVCFAWSEPDRLFWNQLTATVEQGWRFLSPAKCLGNRARLGEPNAGAISAWQAPDELVHGDFDGRLWLFSPPTGEVLSLAGLAREIWSMLVRGATVDAAAARLQALHPSRAPGELREDVEGFVGELVAHGLIVRSDPAPRSGSPRADRA